MFIWCIRNHFVLSEEVHMEQAFDDAYMDVRRPVRRWFSMQERWRAARWSCIMGGSGIDMPPYFGGYPKEPRGECA